MFYNALAYLILERLITIIIIIPWKWAWPCFQNFQGPLFWNLLVSTKILFSLPLKFFPYILKKKQIFFGMNLQNGSQLFFLNYYSSSEIWNYSYYVVIFVRKKFMVCVLDAMATAEKSFSRIDSHLKRTLTKKGISLVCHTK